jgi:ABC-type multidrug transport system permease subunit
VIDIVPPWLEAVAGILGVSFALSGIARAQRHGWRGQQDRTTAYGLLLFGFLMMSVGIIRWIGS